MKISPTDESKIITAENIQSICENIAMQALKRLGSKGAFELFELYHNLVADVHNLNNLQHILSDGYDLVQDAICFLLPFVGKKLGDYFGTSAYGKHVNIKTACYYELSNKLMRNRNRDKHITNLEELTINRHEPFCKIEDCFTTNDNEFDKVDEIIERLQLSKKQLDTLHCYMAGMRLIEIAKHFSVDSKVIFARRHRLQKRYFQIFNN